MVPVAAPWAVSLASSVKLKSLRPWWLTIWVSPSSTSPEAAPAQSGPHSSAKKPNAKPDAAEMAMSDHLIFLP